MPNSVIKDKQKQELSFKTFPDVWANIQKKKKRSQNPYFASWCIFQDFQWEGDIKNLCSFPYCTSIWKNILHVSFWWFILTWRTPQNSHDVLYS